MSLHFLISCVGQIEDLPKATINNANHAERVGLTCQGFSLNEKVPGTAFGCAFVVCTYDTRTWAENLPSGSCKAYLAILLLLSGDVPCSGRRDFSRHAKSSDVYL